MTDEYVLLSVGKMERIGQGYLLIS